MEQHDKKIKDRKERFKNWLKNPYNLALIGILIFTLAIRLYFFSLTYHQALWWDEAEYMLKAKNIAFGTPDTGWWAVGRAIFFPVISSALFKIGFGEVSIRFLFVLMSFLNVLLVFLIARILFNERIALISSLLYSTFYLELFYTYRMLVDMPQIFFVLLGAFLFLKYFYNNGSKKLVWLVLPVLLLGTLIRFTVGVFIIVLLVFLLLIQGLQLFKKKEWYISAVIGVILFIPFMIYSYIKFHNPLYPITYILTASPVSRTPGNTPLNVFLQYIFYSPNYTGWVVFLLFLFGFLSIIFLIALGYDQLRRNLLCQKYFLLLLWVILPLIYFGFFVNHFEDRYIFIIFPAFFMISSIALDKIYSYASHYSKIIAALIIVAVVLFGCYTMLSQSNTIIKNKLDSYKNLKEVGIWIKQNSNPSDILLSPAVPEITYYSERAVYGDEENLTSELAKIKEKNVKYLVVTNWEKAPDWIYTYLSGNQTTFKPVYQSVSDFGGGKFFAVVFSV
jgi:4-amino-4-deoxy-L-arabinose transferase-like glycosyltransferase